MVSSCEFLVYEPSLLVNRLVFSIFFTELIDEILYVLNDVIEVLRSIFDEVSIADRFIDSLFLSLVDIV